jgi:hypothetical protein
MGLEGLQCIFGFVAVALKKEQEALLIKKLFVIVDFVFRYVFVEFIDFFALVLVVFNLAEVEETTSFFSLFRFFLFLCIAKKVLLGKKR